jgi:hypothetical protein
MNEDLLISELQKLRRWVFRPVVKELFPQKMRPVASRDDLVLAEETLALPIPALLARIYMEVGNGGFGPGYGLVGVGDSGAKDDLGNDLVRGYQGRLKEDPDELTWAWPSGWVPLASWGGGDFSCSNFLGDTEVRRFRLSTFHETGVMAAAFEDEAPSLFDFMANWIRGK